MQSVINSIDRSKSYGITVHVQEGQWENKYFLHNKYSKGADQICLNAGIGATIEYDKVKNSKGFYNLENLVAISQGNPQGEAAPAGQPAPAPKAVAPKVSTARNKAQLIRTDALGASISFHDMLVNTGILKAAKNSADLMFDAVMDVAEKMFMYIGNGSTGDAQESNTVDLKQTVPPAGTGDAAPMAPAGDGEEDIPF